jgi:NitT/TauT family transport system substrate-binding protein
MEGTVLIAREGFMSLGSLRGDLRLVLQQFKGSDIGSPPRGSIHDVIIRYYLREAGLEKEVGVRNFEWADLIPEALENGELYAAVGTPALAVVASRIYHVARIIVPPNRLWPSNPSYGIVVRSGFLEMESESIEKFLVLHEEASNFIREHPREAAEIVSSVMGLVDVDFVLETYRVSPKYCAMLSADFVKSTLKFIPVLRQLGYVGRSLGGDEIFYQAIINRVHPEAAHYNRGLDSDV